MRMPSWFARGLQRTMGSSAVFLLPPPPPQFRLEYGPQKSQFADLRLPEKYGPHPVLVVIHGGFWLDSYDLSYISHLSSALTSRGYATWTIEYRRLGNPGGGWPGTFQDVADAIYHLKVIASRYRLDLDRLSILGHSSGGLLALWYAGANKIPKDTPLQLAKPLPLIGTVVLAGITDLFRAFELGLKKGVVARFMGSTPEKAPQAYAAASPQQMLPLGLKQVLLHGTKDKQVPYQFSELYVQQAQAAGDPSQIVPLPNMGHYAPVDPTSSAWMYVDEAVASIFDQDKKEA